MDFGFDGFLDKFEQHWGRGLTKALSFLIGFAVATFCLGVIWQYAVTPVLQFMGVPGRLQMIARIMTVGAAIMAGALLAIRIYDWLIRRAERKLGPSESLRVRIEVTEKMLDALKRRAAKLESSKRPPASGKDREA